MCQEISGLMVRGIGDEPHRVIFEQTNHHEAIIAMHGLQDRDDGQCFARFEATPQGGDWKHLKIEIDEDATPSWLDDEAMHFLVAECDAYRERITIRKDRPAVLGGTWIVEGDIKVQYADRCRFLVGVGSSLTLGEIKGSVEFGDVSGTVTTGDVSGTVTTGDVYGTVTTGDVDGTVTTGYVSGTVTTGYVSGTVTTGDVSGTGSVKSGG